MTLKLKILGCGTSTGVPLPGCECNICLSDNPKNKRNRTSALITTSKGFNILIDAGTDFRQQAIEFKIKKIDSVIFTHAHSDHILGVEDLRGFYFKHKQEIPLLGTKKTLDDIKRVFYYLFGKNDEYKGGTLLQVSTKEIDFYQTIQIHDLEIKTFKLMHGSMPVMGFRFGDISYATDCNNIPSESLKIIKGSKYLILDALRERSHGTHYSINEATELAKEIGAEKTYFIHMTHSIDYDACMATLPKGVELAWDGLEIFED